MRWRRRLFVFSNIWSSRRRQMMNYLYTPWSPRGRESKNTRCSKKARLKSNISHNTYTLFLHTSFIFVKSNTIKWRMFHSCLTGALKPETSAAFHLKLRVLKSFRVLICCISSITPVILYFLLTCDAYRLYCIYVHVPLNSACFTCLHPVPPTHENQVKSPEL